MISSSVYYMSLCLLLLLLYFNTSFCLKCVIYFCYYSYYFLLIQFTKCTAHTKLSTLNTLTTSTTFIAFTNVNNKGERRCPNLFLSSNVIKAKPLPKPFLTINILFYFQYFAHISRTMSFGVTSVSLGVLPSL